MGYRYVQANWEHCILCNKGNTGENLRKIRVENWRIITMCIRCAVKMQDAINLIGERH